MVFYTVMYIETRKEFEGKRIVLLVETRYEICKVMDCAVHRYKISYEIFRVMDCSVHRYNIPYEICRVMDCAAHRNKIWKL